MRIIPVIWNEADVNTWRVIQDRMLNIEIIEMVVLPQFLFQFQVLAKAVAHLNV